MFVVGEKGNKQTVELIKYYSDTELMQLMTIFCMRTVGIVIE
ncbi:unnamed protein product [Candida parapsilosis]